MISRKTKKKAPFKIGLAAIHGIGEQNSDFADNLFAEVRGYFREYLTDHFVEGENVLETKAIWWAPVSSQRQSEFYNRCLGTGLISNDPMHNFFVRYVGDLIAYYNSKDDGDGRSPDKRVGDYQKIHGIVTDSIQELKDQVGPDGKITVVAHSLGTIIMSHWLKYKNPGKDVHNCFFLGSPVSVANMGYRDYGSPGFKLDGVFKSFVEKNDMVAYPLKGTLNKSWDETVTEDVSVNVGGLMTSWNIASHMEYWGDNDVTKHIARILADQYLKLSKREEVIK